jgi:MarR family 2-MHQ and catechol resistance regulon transcriptional repressor
MPSLDFPPTKLAGTDPAALLLEVLPKAMQALRQDLRSNRNELTLAQFRVLANIWRGGMTNRDLADDLGLSVAAMSRVVQGLNKLGYVSRLENPADRREYFIQITRKGTVVFKEIRQKTKDKVDRQISILTAAEKQSLYDGLLIIAKALTFTN